MAHLDIIRHKKLTKDDSKPLTKVKKIEWRGGLACFKNEMLTQSHSLTFDKYQQSSRLNNAFGDKSTTCADMMEEIGR